MDVEKRTTIVAGLNAEPMKQGLREIASEAAKTTAQMTQSTAQMGRALLDASKGFDALAKKWVDGYRDAINYAQAYQTVQRALGEGRDKLGVIPGILDNIERSYGLVGNAARQAAAAMADSSKSAEERLRALQALILQMRQPAQEIARGPDLSGLRMLGDTARRARLGADPGEQRAIAQQIADVQGTANQFAASSRGGWAQANKDAAESAAVLTAELDRQRAAIDPLFAASKRYEEELGRIDEAERLLVVTRERGAALREQATQQFAARNAPALPQTENFEKLRASIDPVYAASKKYEEELNKINEVSAKLGLTQTQTAALTSQATQRFAAANQPLGEHGRLIGQVVGANGQLQFVMRQLGVQAIQTFQGFATGQPIMMTLIQQGHQVADVMLASGVSIRTLGSQVLAFATRILANPFAAVIAGAAAFATAIVALGVHAEHTASRIATMGVQLRATRTDSRGAAEQIERVARHLGQTTTLGTGEARDAARALGPQFRGSDAEVERMVKTAKDLDAVFGKSGEGAKHLAEAMKEPAKVAKQLADEGWPGMSQALAEAIRIQEMAGDKAGAFARALAVMEQHAKGAREAGMGPLQKALADLDKTLASVFGVNGRSFIEWLGNGIIKAASKAVEGLDWVIRKLQALDELVGAAKYEHAGEVMGKQLGGDVGKQIRDMATAKQMSEQQTKLALAIAQQESGGLQIDPKTGKTLTSGAGAMGVMGLMPGTARDLKVDPHNATQNIQGGLDYIQQLWKKYGGDPALVAMAYNWGPGNLDKWLQSGKTLSTVPAETQKYVKAVVGSDLDPARAVETQRKTAQETLDLAEKQWQATRGQLETRIKENQAQQEAQRRALEAAQATGDTQAARKAQETLEHLKITSSDLITEQQKLARSYQDALTPLAAQAGAARELAEIRQRMVETARSEGRQVDEAAVAAAQTARLRELNVQLDDHVERTRRDTYAVVQQGKAIRDGALAMEMEANKARAREEVLTRVPATDPNFKAEVDRLTEAYNEQAQARARNAAQIDIEKYEREIDAQNKVTASVKDGALARQLVANAHQAEEEARQRFVVGSREYVEFVARETKALNDRTVAAQQTNNAVDLRELQKQVDLQKELATATKDGALAQELANNAIRARQEATEKTLQGAERERYILEQTKALNDASIQRYKNQTDTEVAETERRTQAQRDLLKATEEGGFAAQHAANVARATETAFQATKPGEDRAATIERITKALDAETRAANDNQAAQDINAFRQRNEQLELEAKLIGASTEEINRQTAALRERQRFGLKPGDTASPEQQRAIDASKRTADTESNVQRQKAAYQELENFGSQVFNTLGDAMAGSFKKGADAAQIWRDAIGNVVQEVIKEFIKLAILNPLLNSIFGGNRPVLGDVVNRVFDSKGGEGAGTSGGSGSGAGGAAGSTIGTTDIFGKAVNWVGGQGFYEHGGLIGSMFGSGGGGASTYGFSTTGINAGLDPNTGLFSGGSTYHSGGLVGVDAVPVRMVSGGIFDHAPHFQSGLGGNEFAAILHRSERVLTSNQNDRLEHVLGRVAGGETGGGRGGGNVVFNITTPDADSFRASQSQIQNRAVAALNRSQQRNRT
jgi:hypothetical protein